MTEPSDDFFERAVQGYEKGLFVEEDATPAVASDGPARLPSVVVSDDDASGLPVVTSTDSESSSTDRAEDEGG